MERIDEIRNVFYASNRLRQISRRLNGIACRQCNGYRSEAQEKRDATMEDKLTTEAREIAHGLGLKFYHQTDPRGVAVYLIDETMNDSTYNRGIGF